MNEPVILVTRWWISPVECCFFIRSPERIVRLTARERSESERRLREGASLRAFNTKPPRPSFLSSEKNLRKVAYLFIKRFFKDIKDMEIFCAFRSHERKKLSQTHNISMLSFTYLFTSSDSLKFVNFPRL